MSHGERVAYAIANWAPRFVSNGVPPKDFEDVTAAIESWEDWCGAWSARAAIHEEMGREALAAGHNLSAGEHLERAAVLYHFGKYLFVNDMDQLKAAHAKSVECRDLALPHLTPPGERVEIPYEGAKLIGTLRKPASVANPPVMIMCVGLDSTKEEMGTNEDNFLRRGIATLAFDGPGQGEAEYELPIRGDYEAVVAAVADYVATRGDVDGERLGLWGVSLGGYYAPRAAAFENRIKACIGLSGPFDFSGFYDRPPSLSHDVFRVRSHCATNEEAATNAKTLSLVGVAEHITCPLLVVAGELDRIAPPSEAQRLVAEASGPAELLLVAGGNHVVNNLRYRYDAHTADWMAGHLGAG